MDAEKYLLLFRYGSIRDSLLNQLVSAFLGLYRKAAPKNLLRELTSERLMNWISEVEPASVIEELKITDVDGQIEKVVLATKRLLEVIPSSINEGATLIAAGKMAIRKDGGNHEALRVEQGRNIAGTINNLPGDALFLSELSLVHGAGYVAYLRRVVELNEGQVALGSRDSSVSTSHIRISRLTSPYIHVLSQQFGAVFSAIGLPVEYETARSNAISRIAG